jgi:DNA-binding NtrC family response regulator
MHETISLLGMDAVFASRSMLAFLDTLKRAARVNAAVLITGESGSGKELAARALHVFSPRARQPWVDVNCGALPDHLVESELFGFEKGAFSGADQPKQGLFELAHTGTLFLDEIGELDPRVQVKLLRVLDSTPYYRLGGTRKIMVDTRVIAATNNDLEAAAADGRFRRDLLYRISQIRVRVPPLRERPEDIPVLARFFLAQCVPGMEIAPDALAALGKYEWPGNVRELRNVMTQAAALSRGERIEAEDLVLGESAADSRPAGRLDDAERQLIRAVLLETGGHRERAARLLGISKRTLQRKLRLYEQKYAV